MHSSNSLGVSSAFYSLLLNNNHQMTADPPLTEMKMTTVLQGTEFVAPANKNAREATKLNLIARRVARRERRANRAL